MKRIFAALLSLLPACQSGEVPSPSPSETAEPSAAPSQPEEPQSARGLANLICVASGNDGVENLEVHYAGEDGEWLSVYIENAYGLQDPWEDAAVLRATGASAFEIAVLRMAGGDAAARTAEALEGYLTAREKDFTGYAPDQADLAKNGEIRQSGAYVGLFICPGAGDAAAAFEQNLSGGGSSPEAVQPTPSPEISAIDAKLAELMDAALNCCEKNGEDVSQLERLDYSDPDALEAYVKDVYGVSGEQWDTCESAIIAKGPEGSLFEVAIFRMGTDNPQMAGMELADTLHRYLDAKSERLEDPAQAELLYDTIMAGYAMKHCILVVGECWDVAILTLLDHLKGRFVSFPNRHPDQWNPEEFASSTPTPTPDAGYPGRVRFDPPNEEDMSIYDTSAIRAAWEQGDPSPLSAYDRAIYDGAEQVLGGILTDGMSDYEKEFAIYQWVVDNVNYDWTHQNVMAETPRSSYEPYGGLVDRTAVCLGYAATFQLLCDLAGVECVTVVGACFGSTGDHAWNMVRLDGAWYCTDVTWDANQREQSVEAGLSYGSDYWIYFNITSDEMAENDHQWDYANTPEAVTQS